VGTGADCNEVAMAANDIFLWDQQVAESLPAGNVTVAFDDTVVPNEYTIRIAWVEPGENLFYEIVIPVNGF
jgi:hypothetical protein